jgi:HSP20 family protein
MPGPHCLATLRAWRANGRRRAVGSPCGDAHATLADCASAAERRSYRQPSRFNTTTMKREGKIMALLERRRESRPTRWDPVGELEDVYDRMGRLFREVFEGVGTRPGTWLPRGLPLDLEETDDAYIAELELPGVRKDDLTVEVVGNEIRVHGEIKEQERTGFFRQRARRRGVVEHRFTLPGEFAADRIEAELSDGVLTIRAPKAEAARGRRIEIKTS